MTAELKPWVVFPPEFHEHIFFTVRSISNCSVPTKGKLFPQTILNEDQKTLLWNCAFDMMQEEWYDLVYKEKRVFACSDAHSYHMKMEYQTTDPNDKNAKLICFSFEVCPVKEPACKDDFDIS